MGWDKNVTMFQGKCDDVVWVCWIEVCWIDVCCTYVPQHDRCKSSRRSPSCGMRQEPCRRR